MNWIGSTIDAVSQKTANRQQYRFGRKERHAQEEYATWMSNTAHQREVQDLLAAGLNPILSATQGSGAAAFSAGTAAQMDATTSSNFRQAMVDQATIDNLKQDTKLKASQTDVNDATARKTRAETVPLDLKARAITTAEDVGTKTATSLFDRAKSLFSSSAKSPVTPKAISDNSSQKQSNTAQSYKYKSIREGF